MGGEQFSSPLCSFDNDREAMSLCVNWIKKQSRYQIGAQTRAAHSKKWQTAALVVLVPLWQFLFLLSVFC